MANRYRGEIDAEIGGRKRVLVLTLGALAELECAAMNEIAQRNAANAAQGIGGGHVDHESLRWMWLENDEEATRRTATQRAGAWAAMAPLIMGVSMPCAPPSQAITAPDT